MHSTMVGTTISMCLAHIGSSTHCTGVDVQQAGGTHLDLDVATTHLDSVKQLLWRAHWHHFSAGGSKMSLLRPQVMYCSPPQIAFH